MEIDYNKDVYMHDDVEFKFTPYIGKHVAIDKGFYCTVGDVYIGRYVHIGTYVTIVGGNGGLKSEFSAHGFNNIMAGARIVCRSDRFDDSGLFGAMIPYHLKGKQMEGGVVMEEFSNIGTNAIVLPGSILRKGVLLTAGSLLMGDTVEWGVYKGNPAKLDHVIDGTLIIEYAKQLGYEEQN